MSYYFTNFKFLNKFLQNNINDNRTTSNSTATFFTTSSINKVYASSILSESKTIVVTSYTDSENLYTFNLSN